MDALIDDSVRGPQGESAGCRRQDLCATSSSRPGPASWPRCPPWRQGSASVIFLAAHHRAEWAARYLSGLSDPTESGLADAISTAMPDAARGRVQPRWVAKQLIGALLSFVLHEEILRHPDVKDASRDDYLRQVADIIASGVEHIADAEATAR